MSRRAVPRGSGRPEEVEALVGRLVARVDERYRGQAWLYLVEAAARFDPARGSKLSTWLRYKLERELPRIVGNEEIGTKRVSTRGKMSYRKPCPSLDAWRAARDNGEGWASLEHGALAVVDDPILELSEEDVRRAAERISPACVEYAQLRARGYGPGDAARMIGKSAASAWAWERKIMKLLKRKPPTRAEWPSRKVRS